MWPTNRVEMMQERFKAVTSHSTQTYGRFGRLKWFMSGLITEY